jgi:hypothetical protein
MLKNNLFKGWTTMTAAVDGLQRQFDALRTTVICPWGEMVFSFSFMEKI